MCEVGLTRLPHRSYGHLPPLLSFSSPGPLSATEPVMR